MKTFVALVLTLISVSAAPEFAFIKEIEKVNNDIVLRFRTEHQQRYTVEVTSDLSAGYWRSLTNDIYGSGLVQAVTDVGAGKLSRRFYRVRIWSTK